MKHRITNQELEQTANRAGLSTQHDCGGFRLVRALLRGGWEYVFPSTGICPTATKRECMIFLKGYMAGRK